MRAPRAHEDLDAKRTTYGRSASRFPLGAHLRELRVHRGVYAVGHPLLSARGRYTAAVLACGPGAALSHASAAALWELRPTTATKIDVTVATAGGRRQSELRVHRVPRSAPPR